MDATKLTAARGAFFALSLWGGLGWGLYGFHEFAFRQPD